MNHFQYTPDCDTYSRAMRRVSRYGGMAYGKLLTLKVCGTNDCPYGATDGRKLLLNPDGIERLKQTSNPVGYLAFLLVHEALHAQLSHATRLRKLADPMTSNIAADYIINAMIADMNTAALEAGAKSVPFPFIPNVLLDKELSKDRHVVELYNILKTKQEQEAQQRAADQPDNDDGEEGDADNKDQRDMTDEEIDEQWDADNEWPNGGDDADEEGDDTSGDSSDSDSDSDSANGVPANDEPKTDEDILNDWVGTAAGTDLADPILDEGETEESFAEAVDEENERVILQDQLAEQAGTSGPSGSREIVEQRRQWAGLEWSDYVKQWMTDRLDEGWNKPIRISTFAATGLVEDDRESNSIGELAIVVDTSISVPSSVVQEMLDATQDSIDTLRPKAVHLISHDHAVRDVFELKAGDEVPRKLAGGGGTLFAPVFRHIEENCPDIDGIIYLSDLDVHDWNDVVEPHVPVLWLDWCPYRDHSVPFGERIKVSCA